MRLTDYLAIYGAVLSTIVFVWNRLQTKPRIKADLIYSVEGSDDNLKSGVSIVVRNVSSHEVHLAGMDILYPYESIGLRDRLAFMWEFRRLPVRLGWVHSGLSNFSVECGFPVRLDARNSHCVLIEDSTVEAIFEKAIERRFMVRVQDQLWNNVYTAVYDSRKKPVLRSA